ALKLNPKFGGAALKLAQLYAEPLQKRDKALEFAKKARELAPNDAEAAGVLGHVALESDNYNWAYSLLQESARQRRNDPTVLHDLALATYALGRVPEARQTMERCLTAAPAAAQSDDAKRFLSMTARKTLPDDPELARTLAELNFKRKEFSYAIQLFEGSAAKEPLPAKHLYYLGMAQLQTKQDAKGRETLARALGAGLQDPLAR